MDTHLFRLLDPNLDPDLKSGSGSRWRKSAKVTGKIKSEDK
jgi:hypothetical protein